MNIAIIDADLIARKKHRFPNLACMKLSGYYKNVIGCDVCLLRNYDHINNYDKVFISKVFTDTYIDESILQLPNVTYGGTGFFYDKAQPLPKEIEHCMPDYHLYDEYVQEKISNGESKNNFKYYTDYSIGFLTRGCFRKCEFCVNQNYNKVIVHSPLKEFLDTSRKKICLLDDNILGCKDWKYLIQQLIDTGKPFRFQQGMDERILTREKCELLFSAKYDGDMTFAFDNIADYDLIESKLKLIREYSGRRLRFYCFCGFDRNDKWDTDFWKQDLYDLFKRIELLMKYKCIPYIMRFYRYEESPYRGTYINVATWCNQPMMYNKLSYREFCEYCDNRVKTKHTSSYYKYMKKVEEDMPDLAYRYFDMRLSDINIIKN